MAADLHSLLANVCERDPNALALLAPGRPALTYGQLREQLEQIAATLRVAGLGAESRIATVLPNGPEAATVAIALSASACCVPLNPGYGPEELRFYLEDADADAVILPSRDPGPAREVAESLGLIVLPLDTDPRWSAGRVAIEPGRASLRRRPGDARAPAALILHTSGTTARPKIVPLSQANLAASAQAIARHLALLPADRGLNVMPLFHIHGLVGSLFATIAAGASLVCTAGFDDSRFFDWIAEFNPSWYSAVPTIHQAVLAGGARYRERAPEHRFRFVRSSSASLPPRVFEALESLFGAPVIEAYGMTEASHQMTSNPLPPGVRKPGSVGIAAGAAVRILDTQGRPLAREQTGEIAIRGDGVTAGYEANALANAAAFVDGWFRTGDLGRIDADGYLSIEGRIKEIVNRGGEKISPREVDEALLEHPDVVQAAAFAVPHTSLGEDLAAAVVLRPGAQIEESRLREFLFGRLAEFKIPSRLLFVDTIPKGPTGKVQRTVLHKALADALAVDFETAADALESQLAAIFGELLECACVGRQDNFFALGGDSLRGARAIARVNEQFEVDLRVTELFRHPTLAGFADRIRDEIAAINDDDARLIAEIDALSDEDVARLLAEHEEAAQSGHRP